MIWESLHFEEERALHFMGVRILGFCNTLIIVNFEASLATLKYLYFEMTKRICPYCNELKMIREAFN